MKKVALEKLVAHPDNPNRMSKQSFGKLVANIKRTGMYEPLIVRADPAGGNRYQIINGHHRCKALAKLGIKKADVVVWDVDDEQTDILLSTLNRLGGTDVLAKKLALLSRLNKQLETNALVKLLPYTRRQIEGMANFNREFKPSVEAKALYQAMVFFVTEGQEKTIKMALSLTDTDGPSIAAKRADGLVKIAESFIKKNDSHGN